MGATPLFPGFFLLPGPWKASGPKCSPFNMDLAKARSRSFRCFNISVENCISFLDPLIDSWDIDLTNFGMEIVLNRRLAETHLRKLEFVEKEPDGLFQEEPGLKEFLGDPAMSGDATEEEIDFLKRLRFKGSRPTALYYYRELQNLRDPLNFRETSIARCKNTATRRMWRGNFRSTLEKTRHNAGPRTSAEDLPERANQRPPAHHASAVASLQLRTAPAIESGALRITSRDPRAPE